MLSLNHDRNGTEFISSLESVDYPFYGVQFHPEKNAYEWKIGTRIPHSKEAVVITQYFADFFVNEGARTFLYGGRYRTQSTKCSVHGCY